ncbi:hypothetical protein KSP39_PZI015561 [Platanthera zijinensis]|uniref:Uncharacterized protein n=1 Tax=Platanthera zijinensis TaxID=2320716 RepID=A0AAP0B8S1_9ASPA
MCRATLEIASEGDDANELGRTMVLLLAATKSLESFDSMSCGPEERCRSHSWSTRASVVTKPVRVKVWRLLLLQLNHPKPEGHTSNHLPGPRAKLAGPLEPGCARPDLKLLVDSGYVRKGVLQNCVGLGLRGLGDTPPTIGWNVKASKCAGCRPGNGESKIREKASKIAAEFRILMGTDSTQTKYLDGDRRSLLQEA